jgi:hypothetical protein
MFTRRADGSLYKVNDVVYTNGKLTTRSGQPIPDPLPQPQAAPTPYVEDFDSRRLFR